MIRREPAGLRIRSLFASDFSGNHDKLQAK